MHHALTRAMTCAISLLRQVTLWARYCFTRSLFLKAVPLLKFVDFHEKKGIQCLSGIYCATSSVQVDWKETYEINLLHFIFRCFSVKYSEGNGPLFRATLCIIHYPLIIRSSVLVIDAN